MSIAFVTATRIQASTGGSASGTVTGTAGNCWLGVAGSVGAAAYTFSGGGTWTRDIDGANGTTAHISISSAPNITGGSQTVTVSGGGANAHIVGIIQEFSGLPTSSVLDSTPPAVAVGGSSTSATTNSETNSNANAVFIAGVADNIGTTTSTLTGNTAGWTYNPNTTDQTNGSSFIACGTGYQIVSSVAAQSSNWTISSSKWAAAIAAYKAATAVAFVPESPVIVNQSVTNAVSF